MSYKARVVPAASKETVPAVLNELIVGCCADAIKQRGVFTVALSGGSLPSFLSTIKDAFDAKGVDPQFNNWHVILADERCVPSTHKDSNIGALRETMFKTVPVPESQIHGINEDILSESTFAVAADYGPVVREVVARSRGQLDLAVLGFGPDGHTCSLFPGHKLLEEKTKWVAAIEDSPKPPPNRITLTLPILNSNTRHVIFCGAGASKAPILQEVFASLDKVENGYMAEMADPAPYPCGMVRPNSDGVENTLTYVCDAPALEGVGKRERKPVSEEFTATVLPAKSMTSAPIVLSEAIVDKCAAALKSRGVFTVAIGGGSLNEVALTLKEAFVTKGVDPKFDSWYVILGDEKCVPSTHKDSNIGALKKQLLQHTAIPENHIIGINEAKIAVSTAAVASDYEFFVRTVLAKSGGLLDLAVLGIGPDGHTCSLFAAHPLLKENTKWVGSIEDSPWDPPKRVTLTLPLLNSKTRHVIFFAAGPKKAPILKKIISSIAKGKDGYTATLSNPPKFPCGMIRPNSDGVENTLTYVCDLDALKGVDVVAVEETSSIPAPIKSKTYSANLLPAKSKETVPIVLNETVVECAAAALKTRGVFTIALSGGSLPAFLSTLGEAFDAKGVDPKFDSWHVILADERCVPSTDKDSNLGALKEHMFKKIPVPASQIIGINEAKLAVSTAAVASDYEFYVRTVLAKSGGMLDLAVLGFGPDGHTCSLFPGHELLKENTKWVAPIEDSPKPPSKRITLTLPVLNSKTRNVIFCGAGGSKSPVLRSIFSSVLKGKGEYTAEMADPAPYPCGMVRPSSDGSLTYVCDVPALEGVNVIQK